MPIRYSDATQWFVPRPLKTASVKSIKHSLFVILISPFWIKYNVLIKKKTLAIIRFYDQDSCILNGKKLR